MRVGVAHALMTLALALGLAPTAPVLGQGESRDVTFQVLLYGEPPPGEQIEVLGGQEDSDDISIGRTFCDAEETDILSFPPCEGGGRLYTAVPVPRVQGGRIEFRYMRVLTGAPNEVFAEGVREVTGDLTITAYYDYDTGQGGLGEGPQTPGVPDTGGGGMADNGFPVGAAVAISLLSMGGFVALRPHQKE